MPKIRLQEVSVADHQIALQLQTESVAMKYVMRVTWKDQTRRIHKTDLQVVAPQYRGRMSFDVGREYSLSIAAMNGAEVGPFSNAHAARIVQSSARRLSSSRDFKAVAVAGKRSTREIILSLPLSEVNRIPSWLCFPVTIALSVAAVEEISDVIFVDEDSSRENFTCVAQFVSLDAIDCWISAAETFKDIVWQYHVRGVSGKDLAEGKLIQEAPGISSCLKWESAYFCDSLTPSCVRNCQVCALQPHAEKVPICESGGGDGGGWSWNQTFGNQTDRVGQCEGRRLSSTGNDVSFLSPVRDMDLKVHFSLQDQQQQPSAISKSCSRFVPIGTALERLRIDSNSLAVITGQLFLEVPDILFFVNSDAR